MTRDGKVPAEESRGVARPETAPSDAKTLDPLAPTIAGTAAELGTGAPAERGLQAGVTSALSAADDGTPPRVGRYRLVRQLGEGGMGVVYLAHDDQLDRPIALKLLRPDGGGDPSRLLREARSMARLAHPNVATVFDVGTHEGDVYVAMEFVEGSTLREFLQTQPSWPDRRTILLQAAEGLAAAHQAGIVHRDFKPDNVMVGDDGRVRVLDFGLAKGVAGTQLGDSTDRTSTVHGRLLGTPRYMAPEQLKTLPATAASDQFAFCLTAYEAAYGGRAFEGSVFAEIAASVLRGEPREPRAASGVPSAVWNVLARGLKLDPAERFDSMPVLVAEFARASDPAAIVSRPDLRDARAGAQEKLAGAYAESLLDVDELDDRLERLEDARSPATVNHLVADLEPAAAPVPVPVSVAAPDVVNPVAEGGALVPAPPAQKRILSVFSSSSLRPGWTPARHNDVLTIFGSAKIDLRDITLPPGVTEIHAAIYFGSLDIYLPPGIPVENEAVAIFGSADVDEPSESAEPDAPRIRIMGFVLFGSIDVHERLTGEGRIAAWNRRRKARSQQKALKKNAKKALREG